MNPKYQSERLRTTRNIFIDAGVILEARTALQRCESFAATVADLARADEDTILAEEASTLESICFSVASDLQEECSLWLQRHHAED